jgi:hypothetical protein
MRSAKFLVFLLTFLQLVIPILLSPQQSIPKRAKHVQVWCDGDDGYTLRVCEATERAFNNAKNLPLQSADQHATYKVAIASNVHWERVQEQVRIFYSVEILTIHDKKLGGFEGICWESEIQNCGDQILEITRKILSSAPVSATKTR